MLPETVHTLAHVLAPLLRAIVAFPSAGLLSPSPVGGRTKLQGSAWAAVFLLMTLLLPSRLCDINTVRSEVSIHTSKLGTSHLVGTVYTGGRCA